MDFLNKISYSLNKWVQTIVCSMGVAMAAIVAFQVFFRYVLNHSLFWSEELARFILVWLTFLGATVAYYHGAHPGMDGFIRQLPIRAQKGAEVLVHLVSLSLFAIMIINGVEFAWFVRIQITPALNLPKWLIMSVVPASGAVFTVHGLAFMVRAWAGGKGRGL